MSVVYKIFEYVLKYSYEENSDLVFRYVWLIFVTEVFISKLYFNYIGEDSISW
jgi:hypothetical protein